MAADLLLIIATWYKLAGHRGIRNALKGDSFVGVLLWDGKHSTPLCRYGKPDICETISGTIYFVYVFIMTKSCCAY